jgi:ABC-type sugar transport system ATPase subunit
LISISGVRASFGSFRLENVSLDVREGEHLVLLGPSGAGKTLLVETVLGLRRYCEGQVVVAGRVVRGEPVDSVATTSPLAGGRGAWTGGGAARR